MHTEILTEMRELLEHEKRLLLEANIARVAELEPRKLELAEQLETEWEIASGDMQALRTSLQRNQELLVSVSKGLQAARIRLTEIHNVMNNLDTYTRDGGLRNLQVAVPRVERRA